MNEIRVCPACGYGRGFHVFFQPDGNRAKVGLICPSCGMSYQLGWQVEFAEPPQLKQQIAYESREPT